MAKTTLSDSDGWETVTSDEEEATPANAVYQFKINLLHHKPPIWRRILMLSNSTFAELHSAVVGSMGWLGTQLHTFEGRNYEIGPVKEQNDSSNIMKFISLMNGGKEEKKLDETKVKICEHFKKPKDSIIYVYDLDDEWNHKVVLEKILPYNSKKYPICIAGERACPPDDCGGAEGYGKLLAILSNPNDPEHGAMRGWMNYKENESYDPEAFDLNSVTL